MPKYFCSFETTKKLLMSKYGKWIGGGLGWALGGPIGAIMGFVFGTIVDGMNSEKYAYKQTQSGDFSASLIVLSAAIMKADGKIMKSELEFVKKFFIHNFGVDVTKNMMLYLRELQNKNIDVTAVCLQIKNYMDMPSRLQLLHFLFGIAIADNKIDASEEKLIEEIARLFGVSSNDYYSIKAMFVKDNKQAYKILEISQDASPEEIKKAYRKMAIKYHPDKVSHLGDDIQKAAKEKFQQVNDAYESIKKEKGFN